MHTKTFIIQKEAESFRDNLKSQGNIAIIGVLGEKFRVYWKTQDEIKIHGEIFKKSYDESISEVKFGLRNLALKASNEVDEALMMQKLIHENPDDLDNLNVYNDIETAVEAARMLTEFGTLETSKDVLNFIDNAHKYNSEMQRFIKETLDYYDYDATEES